MFGNYRAVSLLGEGGMGSVYLAEHPEIGRKVAVKVLRPEFSKNVELLGRFLNEARAANAIRHPNIIEILDSGTMASGMPYLVMEFLEGETVASRIKRLGKLSLPEAIEFGYQTASALGAAHKKGIVHRDLKPDNVFIVPDEVDPARERIKVLDFGIAKLQAHGAGDSVKTRTGTLMGTPVYMSPEQCLGTKEVDHRSDIYSFGIILYEMMVGKPPFYSEGFGELVNMHINMAPPSPLVFLPSLPAELETVVLRCLAKKADDRYASMAEVQAVLKAGGGPSVMVRGTSSPNLNGGTIPAINGNQGNQGNKKHPTPAVGATTVAPTPTTLNTASGERTDVVAPGGSKTKFLIGGAVAAAAVVVLLVARGGGVAKAPVVAQPEVVLPVAPSKPTPARPVEPPPVKNVRVSLVSVPPGALVVRTDTGVALGVTPLAVDLPRSGLGLPLSLAKAGFKDATHSLTLDGDHEETVTLEPVKPGRPIRHDTKNPIKHENPDEPAKL